MWLDIINSRSLTVSSLTPSAVAFELRPGGTHSGFSSLAKFCLNLRIELAPRSIWELSEAPLLCPPGKGPCSQRRKEEHGCPWHPSLGGTESGHDEQARGGSIQEAVKGRDWCASKGLGFGHQ